VNTNDPKRWKPHGRPLSAAEIAFARTLPKLPVVQKLIPAQTWLSSLPADEEVGEGKPEFSVSLQP
jgi:hypothetical protein